MECFKAAKEIGVEWRLFYVRRQYIVPFVIRCRASLCLEKSKEAEWRELGYLVHLIEEEEGLYMANGKGKQGPRKLPTAY